LAQFANNPSREIVMPYSTINRVVLVGRLTKDPQIRSLTSGTSVCSLRIACNTRRRDDKGAFEEKPNYFDVDVFGEDGDHVAQNAHKGQRVAVEGRLQSREWKNSSDQRREAVSVVADSVQFEAGTRRRRAPRQPELLRSA
jgi:single-strand DNA-binding protein